jgi:hypothetical protein
VWAEISEGDLRFLTSDNSAWVASAYQDALTDAPEFALDSVRNQLALYNDLGLFSANVAEVIKITGLPKEGSTTAHKRILIFTGHMIDGPGREKPRFPPDKESIARQKIKEAVEAEIKAGDGVSFGIAGGASGGDILFHEVCTELGIPTHSTSLCRPDYTSSHPCKKRVLIGLNVFDSSINDCQRTDLFEFYANWKTNRRMKRNTYLHGCERNPITASGSAITFGCCTTRSRPEVMTA